MRTLVLVVLGGVLLYFAWSSFSGDETPADEVPVPEETTGANGGVGQLMSVSRLEEAVGSGGSEPPTAPPPATSQARKLVVPQSIRMEAGSLIVRRAS